MNDRKGYRLTALATILASGLCAAGCSGSFAQADMDTFVDNGMSMVAIRSSSFSSEGQQVERLSSGKKHALNLTMVNPKKLDVRYVTTFDASMFTIAPPASASSSDPLAMSIDFTLAPAAEHKTVSLTVAEYVASINREYTAKTISMLCDSPPNPALSPASAENSATRLPVVGFTLPTTASDDDLASATITWTKKTGGTASSQTKTIDLASLAAAPAISPYADAKASYRYFALDSSNATEGYSYDFEITLIDAIGQKSTVTKYTSAAHPYTLAYDGNGNAVGVAPNAASLAVETAATIADSGNLGKPGYAFISWNTSPDGSGTRYYAGSSLTMPNADVTLYAQWANNGTVVGFDVGNVGLSFTPTVAQVVSGGTITISCSGSELAAGGTNWKWFADGAEIAGATANSLTWPAGSVGDHIISCTVDYNGETDSGSLKVTVTQ